MKKSKLKNGDLILVGSKDSALIFYKYEESCLLCGEKEALDFGNIRLCEKCAVEFSGRKPTVTFPPAT